MSPSISIEGSVTASVERSAIPWRKLSRFVNRLDNWMKWVPEGSAFPSGPGAPVELSIKSRSKVRSFAIRGKRCVADIAAVPEVGSSGLMPCNGKSIAITAKPAVPLYRPMPASASDCPATRGQKSPLANRQRALCAHCWHWVRSSTTEPSACMSPPGTDWRSSHAWMSCPGSSASNGAT